MCMLKSSRSDERCEVQSQQPYASHTCTHSTSSTSDDQSHINAKGYAASLQFILIFVFLLLFSLWVRRRFSCMRNTDTSGRASPFDGLNQNTFISTLSVLSRASPPKLSVPKLLWHNSYMHTDKIAIQESAKAYFPYSAYGWNHRSSTINDNHPKNKARVTVAPKRTQNI